MVELQIARGEQLVQPLEVPSSALSVIAQAAGAECSAARIIHANRPAAMVRQGGKSCILTPRVERRRGLLQLIMTTRLHWGADELLPVELRATCGGRPLRCLTLPETLELLYGHFQVDSCADSASSFASVSERDDYLIPFNFHRLQAAAQNEGQPFSERRRPLLIDLAGVEYPGPAVLGDARGLAEFLQQREITRAGAPEKLGWIIFAGSALRTGEQIEIEVDLGEGPMKLEFALPSLSAAAE